MPQWVNPPFKIKRTQRKVIAWDFEKKKFVSVIN